MIDKCWKETYF